ncbi:XRE family transcriptional regulator [Streptomyces sp. SAI-149]|uniref:helix-turn-helix domain-containing protein n=1 Tax=Streptomyces sp. SAI-149 TaxID=2940542 RepID=UPI00247493B2|nr:XRE family transcriptional regulator [Streptomyces sp. SAI-149]MDH6498594.1 tetratricopeptide (TPR) repeat protein [Streptomyces sp. SAI-149]
MSDERPTWARRIAAEREARQWTQAEAVAALRAHSPKPLPEGPSMIRQWKRWESGEVTPSEFYQPIIASTFGTVTHAIFPVASRRDGNAEIIAASGMETLDIISRMQASDVDNATLDALRITADRLCSEYPHLPSGQLVAEGRQWLKRVAGLQAQRLTLAQHREVLTISAWLALLVGCVEYDMGQRAAAESTRRAVLSLAKEAENAEVAGWAHEMRAWFSLTTGDYHGILAASQAGREAAPHHGVAVQLAAHEAKGWARLGDRRKTEVALDRGRKLLEGMPYPENLDHHFVVDPAKFDYYAMDCYRLLGEDAIAETLANEVIRVGTDFDGTEKAPMRMAEARVTLGVVAARRGDLEQAVDYGEWALKGDRQSLPSLLLVSRELASIVDRDFSGEAASQGYLEHLNSLSRAK